jgi:hypothetical protein
MNKLARIALGLSCLIGGAPIQYGIRFETEHGRKQCTRISEKGNNMSESQYYAGEISDSEIDALADAGEFYLDESGYYFRPSQAEIDQLVYEGEQLLNFEAKGQAI